MALYFGIKMTIKELGIFILSLICLISSSPFYFWGWGDYLLLFCIGFLTIIGLSRVINHDLKLKANTIYGGFVLCLISYTYLTLSGLSIGAILISFLILIVYSIDDYSLEKLFLNFKKIISFVLFPGIVLWFIHIILSNNTFLNLGQIRSDFVPNQYKVDIGLYYYYYPFMTIVDYDVPSSFYRFPGPFDEPGVVGTLASLMLCADKFSLKSKMNKTVFLSGLISFSLVFYITFFIYFSLTFHKEIKRNIFYLFVLISLIFLVIRNSFIGSYFNKLIIDRLIFSNGKIAGDNRASVGLENKFNEWMSSYDLQTRLFGFKSVDLEGSSSIKQIFLTTGLVGFALFTAILMMIFFRRFRGELNIYVLSFLLIFGLSLYQRPDISAVYILLIFSFGVLHLSSTSRFKRF